VGRFGPWQERAAALSRVLRDTEPDVVLLQECWIDESGGDQTAVLAAELGLHHCSGGGELLFGTWGLGNGLLSRWPITDARCESLPALDPSGWGGIALRAVIDGTSRPDPGVQRGTGLATARQPGPPARAPPDGRARSRSAASWHRTTTRSTPTSATDRSRRGGVARRHLDGAARTPLDQLRRA
jgi:hypothetical protein